MAWSKSTGLRKALLDSGSFAEIFNTDKFFIKLYKGTVPDSADDDCTEGTNLLCVISNNGTATGCLWNAAASADAVLEKKTGETWKGTPSQAGQVTYCRIVLGPNANSDNGAYSATAKRLQGEVGVNGAGGELQLANNPIAPGADVTLAFATFTFAI